MNNEERIIEMLGQITGRLDKMDDRFDKMDGRLDKMDDRFDKMDSRLDRIEVVQAQQCEKLDELDTRSLRSAVLLETEVARDIHLVYEGQELLRQKMEELAPKERVEVLEDRVITLETVIKSMSKRLAALEKAQ